MNKLAPGAHHIASSAFALVGCLVLPVGAADTSDGDFTVNAFGSETGHLTVQGGASVTGNVSATGSVTADGVSGTEWMDYGISVANPGYPGVTLMYSPSEGNLAHVYLSDALSSMLWQDNAASGAPRPKMKLSSDNILSLYNSAGSAASITLQGGNGQIHLTGTGSGIYSGGNSVFSLGSGGVVEYGSTRPVSILNATAGSPFYGALRVEGGIAALKDSYFGEIRVGKGNNGMSQNTAVGREALNANTTGNDNTAVGMFALRSNTSGQVNTAMGSFAMYSHTNGEYNAAFGGAALTSNTTGSYNSAFGKDALYMNTFANSNSAFGYAALRSNTAGVGNSAVGRWSLYSNSSGNYNVASGYSALYGNSTGSHNIGIGFQAGRYLADGTSALSNPSNSIFIGRDTRGSATTDSNSIVIGHQAIGEGSNTTVIGNSNTTSTRLYGETKAASLKVSGKSDLNNQVVVEPSTAPDPTVRAMRVLGDGTILIKPSGDLLMGDFDDGAQP